MKRFFSIVLSLLLMFTACVSASAAVTDIADTGDKVVFKDENWAYEKVNVYGWELDEYIGAAAEVSLPWTFAKEYVNSVGDYAFLDNTTVTSVTTTSVLNSIGSYAFNGCTSLSSILLYDSITTLGVGCFYGCGALTDINLQDTSITAVPAYCFAESGITELGLPATCTSIGNMAFYNCSALTKLKIPDSVTQIDDNAFMDCDNLVICGTNDSYAIAYAKANDIDYVITDAVTFIIGDADGDGSITIIDATKIQRVLVGFDPDDDGMITLRGISDGESILNIMHATKIQRYLAGYVSNDPIGKEKTVVLG